MGGRLIAFLAIPLACLAIMFGLTIATFALGSGCGIVLPVSPLRIAAGAAVFIVFGMGIGAAIGLAFGLLRWAFPGTRIAKVIEAARWPIRLMSRRVAMQNRADDGEANLPMPRRRRLWPWLVAVPTLGLLAAAFVAGIAAQKVVARKLDAAIDAADRDDPSWRFEDLLAHRVEVADEENGALVVAEAVSMLPKSWPQVTTPEDGRVTITTDANLAYDRMNDTPANVRPDDATAATLGEELEKQFEALDVARGVAGYARGRHELIPGPTVIDTLLPETQDSRVVARLLAADSAHLAHSGDLDGALDSCLAILGVARSIGDEPFSISQLVRIAIGVVGMQSARRVLGQGEPSDAALARLQDQILAEMAEPLLLHAMRGERASLVEVIRRIAYGELPIQALSDNTAVPDPDRRGTYVSGLGTLWYECQMTVALEWMNEAVAIARRPSTEWAPRFKAWMAEIDRVKDNRVERGLAILPLLMAPAVGASASAHSRYQSELGAMAILLAAERHRLKTGS